MTSDNRTDDKMADDEMADVKMANDTMSDDNVVDETMVDHSTAHNNTANQPWHVKHHRLDEEMDMLQKQGVNTFLQWAEDAKGPIPERSNVDDLQIERSKHVEDAPDDEQDDELEVLVRREAFAQEHHDTMGAVEQYNHPFRHTQTRQYHDSLAEGSDFMLDAKPAVERLLSDAHTDVLPRPDNPVMRTTSAGEARMRMAAVLAAFQEANPEMDATATEDDRDRLLGLAEQAADRAEEDRVENGVEKGENEGNAVEEDEADESQGERILIYVEVGAMEVDSGGTAVSNSEAANDQKKGH